MRFSRTRRSKQSDNAILPLTNIVFLLLIFFLLAGRLTSPEPFDIDPPDSASQASGQPRGLEVQMAANGKLALEGEPIKLAKLEQAVHERLQGSPKLALQLKADSDAQATRVVAVMKALSDAGADRLRLITVTPGR